jgi:hypothetical protein
MAETSASNNETEAGKFPPIPTGFTSLGAPDGQKYLIPTFLTDATCYAYHRENELIGTLPDDAAGGVSLKFLAAWVGLAANQQLWS